MRGKILTIFAVIAWSVLAFTSYVAHHDYAVDLLKSIPSPGLIAFILVAAGLSGLWWYVKNKKATRASVNLPFRGVFAYLGVQLFSAAVIIAFSAGPYISGTSPIGRAAYFFAYSGAFVLGLLVILTAAFSLGGILTDPLRERLGKGNTLVSIALGFSLLGVPLMLLGLAGTFNVYTCWGLVVITLAVRWRMALSFLKDLVWTKKELEFGSWWSPVVIVLLLAVTGFNLVAAFKTFPIGFDGSGLYVNLANLTANTGSLPYGGQAFGWSVMMAFGQTLFGNLSVAMLMSHLMNVLCVLMVYRLARTWLSKDFALLAALIPLLSPYFAFHSIVDEKVDLAFTFILLAGAYLAARTQVQRKNLEQHGQVQLPFISEGISLNSFTFLLLGWLAGYAFTIKYTAILYLFALGVWIFQKEGGRWSYLAALFSVLGLIFLGGIYRFGYLDLSGLEPMLLGAGLLTLGLGLLWYSHRTNLSSLLPPFYTLGLMALTFVLTFGPWAFKNIAEHGSFSVANMIEGKEQKPALHFIPELSFRSTDKTPRPKLISDSGSSSSPKAQFVSQQQAEDQREGRNATNKAAREELQRYLGYEQYFWRYASLPNDLHQGVNLPNSRFVDPSLLFLLFLPILLFAVGQSRPPVWRGVLFCMLLLIALAGSYYATYASPSGIFATNTAALELQNNVSSNGAPGWLRGLYALFSQPLLLLTGILAPAFTLIGDLTLWATLLVLFGIFTLAALRTSHRFVGKESAGIKGFTGFLAAYALFWWILGNGILWYALPVFVAAPIVWLWFVDQPERLLGKDLSGFSRYFGGTILSVFVLIYTLLYFTAQYPGEQNPDNLLRAPFVEVTTEPGKVASEALNKFNPVISDALRIMNAAPSSKIYRVNTHFNFMITENDTRVFSDPVLEAYDQITNRLSDNSKFFDMLKAQGYRYILLDLRTGSIDQTPEQTLKKKFVSLGRELLSSPKVRVLLTDNYVEDATAPLIRLPNGNTTNARYGLVGKTVSLGHIAFFEIL